MWVRLVGCMECLHYTYRAQAEKLTHLNIQRRASSQRSRRTCHRSSGQTRPYQPLRMRILVDKDRGTRNTGQASVTAEMETHMATYAATSVGTTARCECSGHVIRITGDTFPRSISNPSKEPPLNGLAVGAIIQKKDPPIIFRLNTLEPSSVAR